MSVNLALSFAYGGFKTLLIDGDVRRGVQHRVLGHDYRPGLTDVLAESAPARDAVRQTEYANLSLIPSGTRMHRGPELLVSRQMRDLLDQLKARFGIIIVDSPPVAAGIDPLVLATATGNLLLVLRSGTTDVSLAVNRLDVIDTLPVRLVGAVLNDVRGGDGFHDYTYDLTGYPPLDRPPDVDGPLRILGGRS
jgi:capsular exopolysaccharide synthesis family protein